ncbi:hypothetical protein [Prosthecomicrobium pneumaticum]|uniref:Uncharacterized protein n=1 Tax=Prosthecomicrobium pneumaticum TaxID=81895 RepID=A0A7W9FNG3_9HYPH|nr:hypothetical protein [Prosthecomicrobium pneumaticum]MBB5753885.1 hypothetical protein [Prosthecomicrobium pneumaticum]
MADAAHAGTAAALLFAFRAALSIAGLVLVLAGTLPLAPTMPSAGLDPSWRIAINEAVARGLVFGRDVLFTFGPYGSIYTQVYHPATDTMMLAGTALLAVAFGLGLLALGTRWGWARVALAGLALPFALRNDAYLLCVPLLLLVLVCRPVAAAGRGERRLAALAIALLIPATALLTLVKGTFGMAAVLLGGLAFVAALDRAPRRALLGLTAALAALVVFWLCARQPLEALPGYFAGLAPIISGYGPAMGIDGPAWHVALYGAIALLIVIAVVAGFGRRIAALPNALLALGVAGGFFIAFKAGFIRHPGHAPICGGYLLFAALALSAGMRPIVALPLVGVAAAGFLAIVSEVVDPSPGSMAARLQSTARNSVSGLATRFGEGYAPHYEAALAAIRAAESLRQQQGTADVLTVEIAALIANGIDWSPRPVIQSYSAYTVDLAARNAQHLAGPSAPDRLYVRLKVIDGRLPSLEDARSWPVIFDRYRFERMEGDFAVFGKRPDPTATRYIPLGEVSAALGEEIAVPSDAGPVWVEIDSRPTLAGRLLDLFYKIRPLRLEVRTDGNGWRSYRHVAAIGRGGFLLSPIFSDAFDVAELATRGDAAPLPRVTAMRLTAPAGLEWAWRRTVVARMSALSISPAGAPPPPPEPTPSTTPPSDPPVGGACVVDALDGAPPRDGTVSIRRGRFDIVGWARLADDAAATPDAIYVLVTGRDGRRTMFATQPAARPDVGSHFGLAGQEAFGFNARIATGSFGPLASLEILSRKGEAWTRCPLGLTVRE